MDVDHKQLNIKNLTLNELEKFLKEKNIPSYHAWQIFRWIYQRYVEDFQRMTDLSKDLRNFLAENFDLGSIKLKNKEESSDGTRKYAFQLKDNNIIESVIIPTEARLTICLSSQVGCKFNCAFCLSAIGGFVRNLETAEIIDQFILSQKDYSPGITHIVFMGIGEPLDNYDNVLKAIKIFNSKYGLGIGARRITISTAGVIPAIKRLAEENMQFELSVSLHSAVESVRDKLMPINKKYPLDKLVPALRQYYQKTKRQITFEYVLLKDINVNKKNVEALAKLSKGLNCKFNLIAYNVSAKSGFNALDSEEIKEFELALKRKGVQVILRKPRGLDIQAACGQLRANFLNHA